MSALHTSWLQGLEANYGRKSRRLLNGLLTLLSLAQPASQPARPADPEAAQLEEPPDLAKPLWTHPSGVLFALSPLDHFQVRRRHHCNLHLGSAIANAHCTGPGTLVVATEHGSIQTKQLIIKQRSPIGLHLRYLVQFRGCRVLPCPHWMPGLCSLCRRVTRCWTFSRTAASASSGQARTSNHLHCPGTNVVP